MYKGMISVIVPVYNVKEYLGQCVNSIINQTYENLEIILVNDGSTDGSAGMCNYYAENDRRVTVIHKDNGGLSDARNIGVEVANSDFITFVDSDDYVGENYINDMVKEIDNEIDIVISMTVKFYDKIIVPEDKNHMILFNSEEALSDMLYRKNIPIYVNAKLYRKILFHNISFPKGQIYEDLSIMHLLIHKARKIAYIENYNYYYRQRKGSIINSEFLNDKMIQIKECKKLVDFIEREYPAIRNAAYSKSFIVALNLYRTIPLSDRYRTNRHEALQIVKKYKYIIDRKSVV